MNKADSERLESALGQMGLAPRKSPDEADVIVLNTCVVRKSAEDRAIGMVTHLKPLKEQNPEKIIALMGCMVGPKTDTLERTYPYVDVFTPPQQFEPIINLVGDRMGIDPEGCLGTLTARADVATYVPIIHGCDKFCTFCIIPYRRGREVSRKIEEIKLEVEMLVRRGVKEVTLLGQNVDSYGHDLENSPDLADLLTSVNSVDGIERIRFLTSHPNDMSENIIESVHGLEKVCEHINLPFQAGSDSVLERMRRGYSNDEYRSKVSEIRKAIPGVSLSTDVIVGFCGETESDFKETLNLIQDIQFDKVHAAAYSNRAGTIASRNLKDDIPQSEKISRLKALEELQKNISSDINANLVGRTFDVLIEGRKRGRWYGRNRNDKLVYLSDSETIDDLKGETFPVSIEDSGPWSLTGTIIH